MSDEPKKNPDQKGGGIVVAADPRRSRVVRDFISEAASSLFSDKHRPEGNRMELSIQTGVRYRTLTSWFNGTEPGHYAWLDFKDEVNRLRRERGLPELVEKDDVDEEGTETDVA